MRYAICNELFEGWDFTACCRQVADLGYTGLEVAPFTLAPRLTDVTTAQRVSLRQTAADHGLTVLGLHWLFARTEGFHLLSSDTAVRRRTGEYLAALADCCADLGGTVLVFGSPAARNRPDGMATDEAHALAADTARRALPALAARGVTLALEPLGPAETNYLNTAAETMELVRRIDHPSVRLHLDVKAMSTEADPAPVLVRRHAADLAHFHANDPNRRGPGMGDTDFVPIFDALKEVGYGGWVSVEVFDFTPDPVTIARESIAYMRRCEQAVTGE